MPLHLEVERKFVPTIKNIWRLGANKPPGINLPFRSIKFLGNSVFKDTYYDNRRGDLAGQGMYLRTRKVKGQGTTNTNLWELKIRQGLAKNNGTVHEYEKTVFHEETNVLQILETLKKAVPGSVTDLTALESLSKAPHALESATAERDPSVLDVLASMTTRRQSYLANADHPANFPGFTIVIDETDFGHMVGEVELSLTLPLPSEPALQNSAIGSVLNLSGPLYKHLEGKTLSETDHDALQKATMLLIDKFMGDYAWFFGYEKPVGKLSAYFEKFGKFGRYEKSADGKIEEFGNTCYGCGGRAMGSK